MDHASHKYLTINAQKGLYCYNCLAFGITSALALIQKGMDEILKGLKDYNAIWMMMVTRIDQEERCQKLDAVLQCLKDHGL